MEREKGIAYCGLACCVCSENVLCPGCRSGGVDRPKTALLQLLCCVGGNGGDGRIHLLSPCAMLFVALMTMLQQ